jgi:hypothetical protein
MKAMFAASAMASLVAIGVTHAAEPSIVPPAGYQPFSKLVAVPDFIPGGGALYVQPMTLPTGPFLAYDRDGRLVSTIYMIPITEFDAQKKFDDLAVGTATVVDVDIYPNAPHPGVDEPHYHVVLWHVPQSEAKLD